MAKTKKAKSADLENKSDRKRCKRALLLKHEIQRQLEIQKEMIWVRGLKEA